MVQVTQRQVLLAFGANLPSKHGPPGETLRVAIEKLHCEEFVLRANSGFYRNPAFPPGSGPEFVNAAAVFDSSISPVAVLEHASKIESEMGRTRRGRWAARSIDIDLIAMGDLILPDAATVRAWIDLSAADQRSRTPDTLILPHPRLQDRAFVLAPAMELLPHWRHPVLGQTLTALHDALPDAATSDMTPIDPPHIR